MNRKFQLRSSRSSGSAHAKIDKALRRGWQPGFRISDFVKRPKPYQPAFR